MTKGVCTTVAKEPEQAEETAPMPARQVFSKEDFVALISSSKTMRVSIPNTDSDVFVTTMDGNERDAMEERFFLGEGKGAGSKGVRAYVAALTVCDEDGKRWFNTNGDLSLLGRLPAAVTDAIFRVSTKLNRLSDEDIEELAGNSAGAPTDDSGSA